MQLFVLRHGHAEPQKTTDELRNLSELGRRQVAAMAARSLADLKTVRQVWVSPLLRAQQTAQIVCDELSQSAVDFRVSASDLLVPEASPAALLEKVQSAQCEAILLVSHQPLVGALLGLFCGASPAQDMQTSSLACIDYEVAAADLGTLRWLRHNDA